MLTLHRLVTLECIGILKCGTRSFDRLIHATDSRLSSHSRLSSNAFSMVIAGTIRQAALQRDGEGHNPCSYISIARRFVISKFELRNRFSTGADRTTKPKKNSKLKEPEQEAILFGSASRLINFGSPAGSVGQHLQMLRLRHDAPMIRLAVRCHHGYDPPQPEIGHSFSSGSAGLLGSQSP